MPQPPPPPPLPPPPPPPLPPPTPTPPSTSATSESADVPRGNDERLLGNQEASAWRRLRRRRQGLAGPGVAAPPTPSRPHVKSSAAKVLSFLFFFHISFFSFFFLLPENDLFVVYRPHPPSTFGRCKKKKLGKIKRKEPIEERRRWMAFVVVLFRTSHSVEGPDCCRFSSDFS